MIPANEAKIYVVVVAAGQGRRLRSSAPPDIKHDAQTALPKAYQPIDQRCLLECTLDALLQHPAIDPARIQLVIGAEHDRFYQQLRHLPTLPAPCVGGDTRTASVARGIQQLAKLGAQEHDHVLIHDAARPKVSVALITRLCTALQSNTAVVPVLPVRNALKRTSDLAEVARDQFVISQTPQAFHYKLLQQIFSHTPSTLLSQEGAFDDEAAMVVAQGIPLARIEGQRDNIKITDYEDLQLLRQQQLKRVIYGTGFDLHRFDNTASTKNIRLAGMDVAHPHPLIGHSDGDVVIHALCDAIYGTLALGDIGQHFPPADSRWKNQNSSLFLAHAQQKLSAKGGHITHIDCTIIADTPKITPLRLQLCQHLAQLCRMRLDQVSIKATTTEGLGFIDARHAIAAQVIITVQFD